MGHGADERGVRCGGYRARGFTLRARRFRGIAQTAAAGYRIRQTGPTSNDRSRRAPSGCGGARQAMVPPRCVRVAQRGADAAAVWWCLDPSVRATAPVRHAYTRPATTTSTSSNAGSNQDRSTSGGRDRAGGRGRTLIAHTGPPAPPPRGPRPPAGRPPRRTHGLCPPGASRSGASPCLPRVRDRSASRPRRSVVRQVLP